jgi:hypothetical protein
VGLAPVAVLLSAAGAFGVWRASRRPPTIENPTTVRRAVLTTVGVAALLWALPLTEAVTSHPGNPAQLIRFFGTSHDVQPWRWVADVFANELVAGFSAGRELITGDLPTSATNLVRVWAALQLLLVAASAVWLRRIGQAFASNVAALCVLASAIGFVSIRSIVGDVYDYQVLWIGVIGILNVAVLLATAALLVTRRRQLGLWHETTWWRHGVTSYLIAAALIGAWRADGKQRADSADRTLLLLSNDLAAYCDRQHLVRPLLTFDWNVWAPAAGLVLQFYKTDRPIAVADDARFMFGDPFARTGQETAELYLMSVDDSVMPAGVTRFTWIATAGSFRVVQVFRN